MTVAALYVDARGPYVGRHGVDPWTRERDAKLYAGPAPVVAHPDCGPWGQLRHMCWKQDETCGPRAVEQVRAFGGVLEHPRYSTLWNFCGMPKPGELPDNWNGYTHAVDPCDWGHVCRKPTWLYVCGPLIAHAWLDAQLGARRGTGRPTHHVCTGPGRREKLPVASKLQRRITPPAFADLLVAVARLCVTPRGAGSAAL